MYPQHQPLRAIYPKTLLDGFDIEIIKYESSLVAGQVLAEHFVNRYIKINARCDGRNQQYPHAFKLTLLITQYAKDNSAVGINLNADVGLIILKPYECLMQGQITEMCQLNKRSAILLLQIMNSRDQSTTTMAYELARARSCLN